MRGRKSCDVRDVEIGNKTHGQNGGKNKDAYADEKASVFENAFAHQENKEDYK